MTLISLKYFLFAFYLESVCVRGKYEREKDKEAKAKLMEEDQEGDAAQVERGLPHILSEGEPTHFKNHSRAHTSRKTNLKRQLLTAQLLERNRNATQTP